MNKNKVLYVNSALPIEVKDDSSTTKGPIESVYIEGYASTCDVDRTGDVVTAGAWKKGLDNYLKNPIILAFHDHDEPVGRMVEHRIDNKGLWIKARISAAAEIFNLVKDNVLTAFSIGFKVKDAEYDPASEIFMIKEVELVEISVVSVPCNQNTLFSLAKAFDNAEDYTVFKKQFTKELPEGKIEVSSTTPKEWNMSPEEIKQMLDAATKQAAEQATKSLLDKQEAEQAAKAQKAAEEAALTARVESVVLNTIKTVDTGAERLLAEVTRRFEDQNASLVGLESALKEKAAELTALQNSKMSFVDNGAARMDYADREKAVLLSKMAGKDIRDTAFGRELLEKAGTHVPSATWELEVSMNMEAEVRRRLVVAPLLRQVPMKTNVMSIPVNPEAGSATWINNTSFGASASAGTQANHALKEVTLNAYKLATLEYLAYEEEEDALMVLMPIIRDAMVRRCARAIDKAFLIGAGSVANSDPVKGFAAYSTSTTVATVANKVTVANMISLRKDLGALGLDPKEILFFVNTDIYYDLLQDTTFQTMNNVGPQATYLTGQIGQIGGSPVLVSGELPAKFSAGNTAATTTNVGAICVYPPNFIVGNQRGLRFDTQELVETQRRVLVASLRTGMTQVSTNLGMGAYALRYVA